MGRNQAEKLFGDTKIIVLQHPADEGFELLAHLAGKFLPAMGMLGKVDGESDVSELAPALSAASAAMTQKEIAEVSASLFRYSIAEIDGKQYSLSDKKQRGHIFGGDIKLYFNALRFAAEVNFSDFLSEFLGAKAESNQKEGSA